MTTTTTTNRAPSDARFVLDEDARLARLRRTAREMVGADARGECAEPIELDAGFWRERATIAVESERVHLAVQDAESRTVGLAAGINLCGHTRLAWYILWHFTLARTTMPWPTNRWRAPCARSPRNPPA